MEMRPVPANGPGLAEQAQQAAPLRRDDRSAAPGTIELAVVLLQLQIAIGLVSAIGLVVIGIFLGASPLYLLALLLALGSPLLAALCARGLSRRRRWARNLILIYEVGVLLNAALRLLIDHGTAFSLIVSITTIVLPLTICTLVLSHSARAALARPKKRKSAAPVALAERMTESRAA